MKIGRIISVLFLTLFPSVAMSLAGFAEHYSTFHYSDYAKVLWAHPGDVCTRDRGSDQFCFSLRREGNGSFKELENSLEEINVPVDTSSPYVIARRSIDSKWLVYDLEAEQYLANKINRDEALAVWKSLGLTEPRFVDPRAPTDHLEETVESIETRRDIQLTMWVYMSLWPSLVLGALFGIPTLLSYRRYKKTRAKKYLIFSGVLMAPTGLIIVLFVRSLGTLFL